MPALGTTIGALRVVIGAETAGLTRGLTQARSGLTQLSRVAGIATKAVGALGVALPLSGAGLIAMSTGALRAIDSMGNMADQIGIATDQLGGLRHAAASMAGMAEGQFDNALRRMSRRIAQAAGDSGAAANALKTLGLSAQDVARMSPDRQIRAIADAMQGVSDQGQRLKIAFDVFGREGQTMVNMLKDGAAGLDAMQEEAERLGLALDRIQVTKAQMAAAAMDRVGDVLTGIRNQIAIEVAPYITALADAFVDASRDSLNFGQATATGLRSAAVGFVTLQNNMQRIEFVYKSLSVAGGAWADGTMALIQKVLQGISAVVDTAVAAINSLVEQVNRLPGVEIPLVPKIGDTQAMRNVQGLIDDVRKNYADLKKEFSEMQWPGPTEDAVAQVDRWFDNYESRVKEAAESLRSASGDEGSIIGTAGSGGDADKERKALQDRLDQLRDFLDSESNLRLKADQEKLATLEAAHQAGLVQTQDYYELLEALSADHFEAMDKFEAERYQESIKRLDELHEAGILGDQEYRDTLLERQSDHEDIMTQLLVDAFENRKEILDQMKEDALIDDEDYKQRMLDAEEEFQNALTTVSARGEQNRAQDVRKWADYVTQQRFDVLRAAVGFLDQLAGKSKAAAIAAIALQKGLAIAETIVSTQAAAMRALAELGPIAGAPVAAKIEALGAMKVGIIAATGIAQAAGAASGGTSGLQGGASGSIGGRSSAPSSSTPGQTLPEAPKHSVVTINLEGEVFGRQQVRDLIEQINEAVADGSTLRVE